MPDIRHLVSAIWDPVSESFDFSIVKHEIILYFLALQISRFLNQHTLGIYNVTQDVMFLA